MLTRQQMFNTAYHGLAAQGFVQSMRINEKGDPCCLYRGPEGRRCALGYLIPDSAYSGDYENTSGHFLTEQGYIPNVAKEDASWVNRLQMVHDHNHDPEEMRQALVEFAIEWSLTVPELPVSPIVEANDVVSTELVAA